MLIFIWPILHTGPCCISNTYGERRTGCRRRSRPSLTCGAQRLNHIGGVWKWNPSHWKLSYGAWIRRCRTPFQSCSPGFTKVKARRYILELLKMLREAVEELGPQWWPVRARSGCRWSWTRALCSCWTSDPTDSTSLPGLRRPSVWPSPASCSGGSGRASCPSEPSSRTGRTVRSSWGAAGRTRWSCTTSPAWSSSTEPRCSPCSFRSSGTTESERSSLKVSLSLIPGYNFELSVVSAVTFCPHTVEQSLG